MNIIRNYIYQGKNLFRDGTFLFWAMVYPIILAFFFNLAFSSMMNVNFDDIQVGIEENNYIFPILEEIEFINIHKITQDQVDEKLFNEEIDAFVDSDLHLTVKKIWYKANHYKGSGGTDKANGKVK